MNWNKKTARQKPPDGRVLVSLHDLADACRRFEESGRHVLAFEREHYHKNRAWGDWLVTLSPPPQPPLDLF